MKSGAIEHPKMKRLGRALGNRATAIGTLEALWAFARQFAPAGDIGRYTDEDLAEACYWEDGAEVLVDALVRCGWVDRNDQHRLVIHDWADHCEDSVHMKLKRAGLNFAAGNEPKDSRLSKRERTATAEDPVGSDVCAHGVRTVCAQEPHGVRTALADTDTEAYAYADPDALAEPQPAGAVSDAGRSAELHKRDGRISSAQAVGNILAVMGVKTHPTRAEQLHRASGDPPEYGAWWDEVVQRLDAVGQGHVALEALAAVADAATPESRRAKDCGVIRTPGRRMADLCGKAIKAGGGLGLPPPPGSIKRQQGRNGQERVTK